jgi:hypothetical protein
MLELFVSDKNNLLIFRNKIPTVFLGKNSFH